MKATINIPDVGICPTCNRPMDFTTEDEVGKDGEFWSVEYTCELCLTNVTYIAPNVARPWDEYENGEIEIHIQSFHR